MGLTPGPFFLAVFHPPLGHRYSKPEEGPDGKGCIVGNFFGPNFHNINDGRFSGEYMGFHNGQIWRRNGVEISVYYSVSDDPYADEWQLLDTVGLSESTFWNVNFGVQCDSETARFVKFDFSEQHKLYSFWDGIGEVVVYTL